MDSKTFAVIGGDQRQCHLAELLRESGSVVTTAGLEEATLHSDIKKLPLNAAIAAADVIILPLPLTSDQVTVRCEFSFEPVYLADIFSHADQNTLIVAGKVSEKLLSAARARGIRLVDYFEREELSVLNSIPTAEGALQIAMENTAITLFGSSCLVVGYGRIGKILSADLKHLGAKVTVSARKCSDFAWIEANGLRHIPTSQLANHAGEFDIIFNTVPHLVLNEQVLRQMKPDTLIVDLASVPGGVDFDAAAKLGIRAVQALSLPGKVAPRTAAKIVLTTIRNLVEENPV